MAVDKGSENKNPNIPENLRKTVKADEFENDIAAAKRILNFEDLENEKVLCLNSSSTSELTQSVIEETEKKTNPIIDLVDSP